MVLWQNIGIDLREQEDHGVGSGFDKYYRLDFKKRKGFSYNSKLYILRISKIFFYLFSFHSIYFDYYFVNMHCLLCSSLLGKFWKVIAVWERLVRWVSVSIISYKVWLKEYLCGVLSRMDSIIVGLRSYLICLLDFPRELVIQYKVYCLKVCQ